MDSSADNNVYLDELLDAHEDSTQLKHALMTLSDALDKHEWHQYPLAPEAATTQELVLSTLKFIFSEDFELFIYALYKHADILLDTPSFIKGLMAITGSKSEEELTELGHGDWSKWLVNPNDPTELVTPRFFVALIHEQSHAQQILLNECDISHIEEAINTDIFSDEMAVIVADRLNMFYNGREALLSTAVDEQSSSTKKQRRADFTISMDLIAILAAEYGQVVHIYIDNIDDAVDLITELTLQWKKLGADSNLEAIGALVDHVYEHSDHNDLSRALINDNDYDEGFYDALGLDISIKHDYEDKDEVEPRYDLASNTDGPCSDEQDDHIEEDYVGDDQPWDTESSDEDEQHSPVTKAARMVEKLIISDDEYEKEKIDSDRESVELMRQWDEIKNNSSDAKVEHPPSAQKFKSFTPAIRFSPYAKP
jgi:hypothetical protein